MPSPPALLCKTLIKEPLFGHELLRQLCLAALLLIFTPDSEGPAGSAPGSNSCLTLRNCGWALLLQGSGRAPRGWGAAPDRGWVVNRSPPQPPHGPVSCGGPQGSPHSAPHLPLVSHKGRALPRSPIPNYMWDFTAWDFTTSRQDRVLFRSNCVWVDLAPPNWALLVLGSLGCCCTPGLLP